jgi:hypothetical protein
VSLKPRYCDRRREKNPQRARKERGSMEDVKVGGRAEQIIQSS